MTIFAGKNSIKIFPVLQQFIVSRIVSKLPFVPNEDQRSLIGKLGSFLLMRQDSRLFLLKGYAGTGKTSIVAALVKAMQDLQQKTVLLAPTGRAAKVLSGYAGVPAYTIHKKIYRQRALDKIQFGLNDNLHTDTLFIVDEASMVSNQAGDNAFFGTGRLLDDLIRFVYGGRNCALLLLGDTAQLPPVKQIHSPALDAQYLSSYGLDITEYELTQVARQALESGILFNATRLRNQMATDDVFSLPEFKTTGFTDVTLLSGGDVLDELQRAYDEAGAENTLVITRSNKRANLYNQAIRARILWKEDELSNGDMLMVTRNNYFWTKQYEGIDFLANGDMLEIVRVRKYHEMYGMRFVELSLRSMDYDWEIDAMILLDSIYTEMPDKNYELGNLLFQRIAQDYPEIRNRKQLVKTVMESPYYNALHVRFAYAVTCHKAQGGQWKRVFVDQGQVTEDMLGMDYYRWCYTAVTRATEKIFLIQ